MTMSLMLLIKLGCTNMEYIKVSVAHVIYVIFVVLITELPAHLNPRHGTEFHSKMSSSDLNNYG